MVVNTCLLLAATPYAFGLPPDEFFLSDAQAATRLASISQPIWGWSMALVKISFSLMLLRISPSRFMKRFLWSMIGLQIVLAVYNTLATLLQCIPVEKAWDLLGTVEGHCWSRTGVRISSITVSVVHILTDFILALLPVSFLRGIQRPVRERVIVGALMGLGFFTGVASILKIIAAMNFGKTGDPMNESIIVGMWSAIEELVGFIVICVPTLRSPFQHVLRYLGVASVRIKNNAFSRGYGRTQESEVNRDNFRNHSQSRLATVEGDEESGFKLKELHTEESKRSSDEMHWRANERNTGNGEIWCTHEVVVQRTSLSGRPSLDQVHEGADAPWKGEPLEFDLGMASRHLSR
ncbi:uncharacterized protein J4E87_005881 [Alternaria ethzedia]|uniref:uncharacterized protein n=1 Tax=Alternaria ethzedia TaxID=181014 RepID=UPI0020C25629|nr:uncharacterized protein J4E87_005881 [Alternaria ethzedia]KAI4622788.1 hypothetical protein J4E87_005881 [Alternaria ethzedia]